MKSLSSLRGVYARRGNLVILFILLIISLAVFLLLYLQPIKSISLVPSFPTDFAYDNRTFLPAVAKFKSQTDQTPPKILVIPHHLLASDLIAQGISSFTSNPPKNIVILSPNHANVGQCDIISSKNYWNTPFDQVVVNQEILSGFIDSRIACEDDINIGSEWGIAGLLPFIKYYLPQTSVVPFALKKDIDPKILNSFVEHLSGLSDTAIVASVDFSHGLTQKEAIKKDKITENILLSSRYEELLNLSSEYLDSPVSLYVTLKILEDSVGKPTIISHTDSSFFNGSSREVTSYFLITRWKLPNIEKNKEDQPQATNTPVAGPGQNEFSLLFAGDVMLGRTVNTRMLKYGDFSWPFKNISQILSGADLTVVNLESPFRSGCKPTDTGMVFCADPRSVEGLTKAGIDVVNLANNHIDNQGSVGVEETLFVLLKAGIGSIGQAHPYLKTIKGTSLALVGFSDIQPVSKLVSSATKENIKNEIEAVRNEADIVIASFHWGNEYSKRSLHQMDLAHFAIDSGADIIIGHHPHWVQEIETYKGKPIYYSLGNLVFDQMWSEETRKGLVVKFTFNGSSLIKQEHIPVKIFDYGQPNLN